QARALRGSPRCDRQNALLRDRISSETAMRSASAEPARRFAAARKEGLALLKQDIGGFDHAREAKVRRNVLTAAAVVVAEHRDRDNRRHGRILDNAFEHVDRDAGGMVRDTAWPISGRARTGVLRPHALRHLRLPRVADRAP